MGPATTTASNHLLDIRQPDKLLQHPWCSWIFAIRSVPQKTKQEEVLKSILGLKRRILVFIKSIKNYLKVHVIWKKAIIMKRLEEQKAYLQGCSADRTKMTVITSRLPSSMGYAASTSEMSHTNAWQRPLSYSAWLCSNTLQNHTNIQQKMAKNWRHVTVDWWQAQIR